MRMMVALIVLILSGSVNCEASFIIANHLLSRCQNFTAGDDYTNDDERICHGYIMGVHDTVKSSERLFEEPALYCEPARVSSEQMVLVVKKFLKVNPELLHYSASSTVVEAFIDAYPCPE